MSKEAGWSRHYCRVQRLQFDGSTSHLIHSGKEFFSLYPLYLPKLERYPPHARFTSAANVQISSHKKISFPQDLLCCCFYNLRVKLISQNFLEVPTGFSISRFGIVTGARGSLKKYVTYSRKKAGTFLHLQLLSIKSRCISIITTRKERQL